VEIESNGADWFNKPQAKLLLVGIKTGRGKGVTFFPPAGCGAGRALPRRRRRLAARSARHGARVGAAGTPLRVRVRVGVGVRYPMYH
jgi:hypothetical protein